jgi:hypothetical protein
MSKTNYSGSIALTKLVSVEMEMNGKTGKVKGIFIPYAQNYIEQKEGAAYLSVNVVVSDEPDKYQQNGFISHKMDSKTYKAMPESERKEIKLPILGNIKNFATGSSNDNSGKVTDECLTPESDLPF